MSYILEALRKSEKKRQQEKTVSQLHDIQPAPVLHVHKSPKIKVWLYLVALLTLLCTRTMQLVDIRQQEPAFTHSPRVMIQPLSVRSIYDDEIIDNIPQKPHSDDNHNLLESSSRIYPAPTSQANQQVPQAPDKYPDVFEPAPLITTKRPPTINPLPQVDMSKYNAIPFLQELSPAFQQNVPNFKLAGHVYSADPKLRLILINDIVARENDVIEKEFILDEIIPGGIILRSGNTQFRLGAD